uniref:Uncharacterized protein n=1 Tax=Romanomermis culicivorax TaxID=13658 RepID=A0A915KQW7_ROMCU
MAISKELLGDAMGKVCMDMVRNDPIRNQNWANRLHIELHRRRLLRNRRRSCRLIERRHVRVGAVIVAHIVAQNGGNFGRHERPRRPVRTGRFARALFTGRAMDHDVVGGGRSGGGAILTLTVLGRQLFADGGAAAREAKFETHDRPAAIAGLLCVKPSMPAPNDVDVDVGNGPDIGLSGP